MAKQNETPKQPKYYKILFFQVSDNIFFTYLYLFTSVSLTIVNKILFQKFNFKFNLTLMFLQQLFCSIFFKFAAPKFENFEKIVGEISLNDFLKLKGKYAFFSSLFIMNYLTSFLGMQLVVNTAMLSTLRKFLTVMNFLYDKFINRKTLPNYFTQSVLLITLGALFTGYDDLTSDWLGYFVMFVYNTLSVLYGQFSESFAKKNGIPNVKLIIYNSFLSLPFLLTLIVVTGEHLKLIQFYNTNVTGLMDGVQLLFCLSLSCSLAIVLNMSLFVSYEKNSSLFTQLVAGCGVKYFFILGYLSFLGVLCNIKGLQSNIFDYCRDSPFKCWCSYVLI